MTLDTGLAGRRALVVGGGSGIGRAIALGLAAEGASVAIAGRAAHPDVIADIARQGVLGTGVVGDVGLEADAVRIVAEADDALGGIDLLVNSAAVRRNEPLAELTAGAWAATVDSTLFGCVLVCREATRRMLRRGSGSILLIGSTATASAQPYETAYRAAKAGVRAHAEVLAVELAARGIRVNLLTPGAFDTPFVADLDPMARAAAARDIPMGREGAPPELVPLALVLLSNRLSPYTTGAEVFVDGGAHLRPLFLPSAEAGERPSDAQDLGSATGS